MDQQKPKPDAVELPPEETANVTKIETLLKSKDDTQRFVGLALLKSVLDNSEQLRETQDVIQSLWASVSAKFLDRLLRTGAKPSNPDAKAMLDLVVSVLHIFAILLPDEAIQEAKFTDRIPGLIGAALHSSDETTILLLQLLHTLASRPEGAAALVKVEDLSPLTEIAPSNAIVLDILCYAWLNSMAVVEDKSAFAIRVNDIIQTLVSSFTGTDAVTLLEFLGTFLRQADSAILTLSPKWLGMAVGYIRKLVTSRPTPEARSAYTNAAASLLAAYPTSAPELLFSDKETKDDKPFGYLFINLLLIDIRSSAPMLLEQLNRPGYANASRRLASAFDIICIFIGYLVRSLEDESLDALIMSPDSLLKLRKGISDTMSVTLEYLRDRWDASVAGAMGLHPDARTGTAATSTGSHHTLVWDSLKNNADEDPLILSAVRASALWLREDENDLLRKEATGLTDMYMDLYQSSSSGKLDFRSPILVALEALVTLDQGRELLLSHGGWQTLCKDLAEILRQNPESTLEREASRGIDIIRVLLAIAEQQGGSTTEQWMDLITIVAAWDCPESKQTHLVQEFQVAVLQLCCTLLANAGAGTRRRYTHSMSAINGVARRVDESLGKDNVLREAMDDVLKTLKDLSRR